MMFFYLVATVWMFDISIFIICNFNQLINQIARDFYSGNLESVNLYIGGNSGDAGFEYIFQQHYSSG